MIKKVAVSGASLLIVAVLSVGVAFASSGGNGGSVVGGQGSGNNGGAHAGNGANGGTGGSTSYTSSTSNTSAPGSSFTFWQMFKVRFLR